MLLYYCAKNKYINTINNKIYPTAFICFLFFSHLILFQAMPKQCFGVILGPHYEFFNRLGHESYTDPSLKSGVMKDAFELGQPSLPGCDVISLQMQPRNWDKHKDSQKRHDNYVAGCGL